MEITVQASTAWPEYVVAFGTAAAALFAAWAAWTARSASLSSRDLVMVETARDKRAAEEARWRQARRVTVDLMSREIELSPSGRTAFDAHLVVTNASPDPIFNVRIKIVIGDASWGPQLIGTMSPWHRVAVTARLITDADVGNTDGFVRLKDVEGAYWIASARRTLVPDSADALDTWIEEGIAFAHRPKSRAERGESQGVDAVADLESWTDRFPGTDDE